MIKNRILLSGPIALPFFGDHMQELQTGTLSELAQRLDEHGQIMSVNRADVVKAKLFKERTGREHALDMLFKPARKRKKTWQMLEEPLAQRLGGTVKAPEQKPCEIVAQGAHRRGNRHLVVV